MCGGRGWSLECENSEMRVNEASSGMVSLLQLPTRGMNGGGSRLLAILVAPYLIADPASTVGLNKPIDAFIVIDVL
jgi:hypothetical protein